jgi:pimeloyl-ACP methyl ester carboxylesterase
VTVLFSRASVILLLATASTALADQIALPAPTGPHRVGRQVMRWTDSEPRATVGSDPTRDIVLTLWYPADVRGDRDAAPYVDHLDTLAKVLSADELALARTVRAHAVVDAPPITADGTLPLLLFSAGAGSMPELYTSLAEDLASHGYVFAAVAHPYEDRAVVLRDGRIVQAIELPADGNARLRDLRRRVSVRARDIAVAIDHLERATEPKELVVLGRIDRLRIGVIGHSLGGLAAARACAIDPRVRACANLDGVVHAQPAYPDARGQGPAKPFLFIDKPLRALQGESPAAAATRTAGLRARADALLDDVARGRSYHLTLLDATHQAFSDEAFLVSGGSPGTRAIIDLTRRYVREFFDGAVGESRDGPLADDVGARVTVFTPRGTGARRR